MALLGRRMQLGIIAFTRSNGGLSLTQTRNPQSGSLLTRGARRIATRRSRRRESADPTALRESAASRQRLQGAFSRHLEPLARDMTRATRNLASQSRHVAALTGRLDAESGNASALSDNLKALTGDIDALNDNTETLTVHIGVLKSDVDAMSRDRGALTDNADALKCNVNALKDIVFALTDNVFAKPERHSSLICSRLQIQFQNPVGAKVTRLILQRFQRLLTSSPTVLQLALHRNDRF